MNKIFKGYKIQNGSEILKIIKEYENTEKTQKEICSKYNIGIKTFSKYYNKYKNHLINGGNIENLSLKEKEKNDIGTEKKTETETETEKKTETETETIVVNKKNIETEKKEIYNVINIFIEKLKTTKLKLRIAEKKIRTLNKKLISRRGDFTKLKKKYIEDTNQLNNEVKKLEKLNSLNFII
jgi:hypothetical protein